jgi:hypothetical protein
MRRLPVLFAVFALTASLAAFAEDTIGWHVVRAGETLEGITARYLGTSAAWRENWKLNPDVKNPNMLVPGQRIRVILARMLPARFAKVERLSHRVQRKPEPEPWVAAHPGDVLAQRHGVQTFENSSAQLHFDDDTVLTLTESSMVFLRELRAIQPQRDRSDIEIVDGTADVERPSKPARAADLQIIVGTSTTTPKAAAGGTRARVRSDNKTARVMAYRGAAAVASGGASVDVPQGMGVSVPPGQKPTKPERLLPAPTVANIDTRSARPLLRWTAVPGATSYTVEVCRDAQCGELVTRATDLGATSWSPAAALPDGEMFWRVTGRSGNGLDGYSASAARLVVRLAIAGTIRIDGKPAAGVKVTTYRDAGDGAPTDDDALVSTLTTSADGTFTFAKLADGLHWVVVDSRAFGGNGWPDQTDGPAGAICAGVTLAAPGPCAGGRSARSDDARVPSTAEHIAGIRPETDVRADMGFSFDVVTSTNDGEAVQGSLRQFLTNANARGGAHSMRFMPAIASEAGWWSIAPKTPLPAITNAQTTIDGGSLGRGSIGTGATVGRANVALENPDRPRLAIDFAAVSSGLDVRAATTIRNIALVNGANHVTSSADLRIENSVIGLSPDGSLPTAGVQRNGIKANGGTVTLRRVLFAQLPSTAIEIAAGARLDAEHIEVRSCGFGAAAFAVILRGNGSKIRNGLFHANASDGGAAVDVHGSGNEVSQSAFRANGAAIVSEGQQVLADNVIEP